MESEEAFEPRRVEQRDEFLLESEPTTTAAKAYSPQLSDTARTESKSGQTPRSVDELVSLEGTSPSPRDLIAEDLVESQSIEPDSHRGEIRSPEHDVIAPHDLYDERPSSPVLVRPKELGSGGSMKPEEEESLLSRKEKTISPQDLVESEDVDVGPEEVLLLSRKEKAISPQDLVESEPIEKESPGGEIESPTQLLHQKEPPSDMEKAVYGSLVESESMEELGEGRVLEEKFLESAGIQRELVESEGGEVKRAPAGGKSPQFSTDQEIVESEDVESRGVERKASIKRKSPQFSTDQEIVESEDVPSEFPERKA
jgi:hypothetical protein